jgi:hypothetical protein
MSLDGGAKKASKIAAQTADKNNALATKWHDESAATMQPTVDRGNSAGAAYNALLGLGGDTAGAGQAFQNYEGSTGHDFRLKTGMAALDASAAARGGLLSGSALKDALQYGQDLGTQDFGQYLGNLDSQQRLGVSDQSALAGVNQNLVNGVTANNNTAASAAEEAARAKAAGINSLIGTGIGLASSFATGGLSSAAGGFSAKAGGLKALKFLGG